jgi:short-chain 2-methylacyl-CoA dehydrogenase
MPVTTFSEDEDMIRQLVRQWARDVLLPVVRDMDDQGQLRPDIVTSLFENGFMGMVSSMLSKLHRACTIFLRFHHS